MKTIVALLVLVAFASTSPLKKHPKKSRSYLAEENDPNRMKYLLFQDEQGLFHYEDLTTAPKRKATLDDVELYLYTRQNTDDGVKINISDLGDLVETPIYDPAKDHYFIVHGWSNDYTSPVNVLLKDAILTKKDGNVFVVGWGEIANKGYVTARGAVPDLGLFLGNFINNMLNHYNISPEKVSLIGHSLGAHIAGCAGAEVKGLVKYIAGLDPASPLFTIGNTDERLDTTDAKFVQVVHTSGALLGFSTSIGHADYFPNGGSKQPGCGVDVAGTCAHSRAYLYYAESILSGGFNGPECNDYKNYKKGKCDENPISFIGSINLDTDAEGDYYLNTNKKSPFSLD